MKISDAMTKELKANDGWAYATEEAREKGARDQARGDFLKALSPRARRLAATVYDADEIARAEVLNAFRERRA